ncbi:hypothetical protein B4U79_09727 [Dinothrombium tinctorium]|uniref:Glycosyl transferase CAP10 domain-containing protein n=1 Tax=Dinothrombium tinctorium TaxID=1965070 RepID=A0A443RH87_9ACAR|nr:hypothetical protein B4U79_01221 [Dinothrombium tinctorium]RWS14627.1 hypothetical protein B4U79_09727 [Dinothrombium tinctorium]
MHAFRTVLCFYFVFVSKSVKNSENSGESNDFTPRFQRESIEEHEKQKYAKDGDLEKWRSETEFDSRKFANFFESIKNAENAFQKCEETVENGCDCFEQQIDSDLRPFQSGINFELIESSKARGVHYQVISHKLYRQKSCMFPLRCKGIEHFLLDLIHSLNDSEFVFNVHDWPQVHKSRGKPLPVFSFSKDTENYNDIIYPAWSFWSGGPAIDGHPMGIGRWDLLRSSISKNSPNWEMKKPIAFFRGSRTSSERDPLIYLSRKNPDIIEARYTKNQAWRSKADTLGDEPASIVSFEHHCVYKYLFNLRGVAASFRHRHLFLCKSVVLNVESTWIEFYYNQLKPWIHYIPIEKDLSNVEETLEFLLSNDAIAEKIALNGFNFIWNHLTLETVQCYWKKLIHRYQKLLKYKPTHSNDFIEIKRDNK